MQHIFVEQKKQQQVSTNVTEISDETDDVYYRFGGAAIATMLHVRYDSLKGISDQGKASLKVEIELLRYLECTDKSHVPEYLQYRDRGYMHFPKECFIPFLNQ